VCGREKRNKKREGKEFGPGMDPCGVSHLSYSCCSSMILPVWAAQSLLSHTSTPPI